VTHRIAANGWATSAGVAFGAALVMAYHVAARATRDTLFLTSVGSDWLPHMVAAAAVVAIAAAFLASGQLTRRGPRRFVPAAFVASAILTMLEWWWIAQSPRAGAVIFFLHVAGLAPVLVSGFWSALVDSFDPRTTRMSIGRIAAISTAGGLAGLVVAERCAALFGLNNVLPALAAANLACAVITARMKGPLHSSERATASTPASSIRSAWSTLLGTPHLANLALIVLGASTAAGILDLAFKSTAAAETHGSMSLMRALLGFNGIVMLGTFLLQMTFRRVATSRGWIVRTIASLFVTVVAGCVSAFLFPAAWLLSAVRGAEAVLHGSLFRGGYELLYAGLPRSQKLSVRSIIDVGCDRAGDLVATAVVLFVASSLPVASTTTLLLAAAAIGAAGLLVVVRLPRGHSLALEESLRALAPAPLARLSALQFSMGAVAIEQPEGDVEADAPETPSGRIVPRERPDPAPTPAPATTALDPEMVPATIRRLAVEGASGPAGRMLVAVAERHAGQLVDALLDDETDSRVRQAIPSILESCPTPRAVEGLVHGLTDPQFEVRSRCSAALSRLRDRGTATRIEPTRAYEAVRWELQQSRVLFRDRGTAHRSRPDPLEGFLEERRAASLEHVFHLLSLVLPLEPLMRALQGIRAEDSTLHGTSLEYLDEMLPADLVELLGPSLTAARPSGRRPGLGADPEP
jgi:hypothetical protein